MRILRFSHPQVLIMLSQLNHSSFYAHKSLNLKKNPYHTLLINTFGNGNPHFISKSPHPYHNLLKTHYFYSTTPRNTSKDPSPSTPWSSSIISTRKSRNEAQVALFDYLHVTRNLEFSDAEHISKNSPTFVDSLLSKVKDGEEITRSLAKHFRYHPINEFEPFFESLGLTPAEFRSLLPRELMFLSDDDVLLENFHVLCSYGIPRSKIGKIYKEEPQIFKCSYGILASTLQAYEELGLSTTTVSRLVICCPVLLIGGVSEDFRKVYGRLENIGFGGDWVRGRLSERDTYNWGRMFDMICFLDGIGCSSKDMGKLLKSHPGFLFEESGKKFYILVALLLKVGLKGEDILFLFLNSPRILAGSSVKNIWRLVNFLTEIGMGTKDITNIISTHTQILGHCVLKQPATVMSNLKVGRDRLCEIIKEDPVELIKLASLSKSRRVKKVSTEEHGHLVEKTRFLKSIGYVENSDDMVKAFKHFRGRGDQLQERFDCLVSAGLDFHDVSNMIKAAPPVLNQSKEVIETKIVYLVNQLGYPLQSLVGFPTYLCYDIEKIKLRFSMYLWLKEEGGAKPMLALSTILACSDIRFVKYFVNVHPKGTSVWESLKNSSSSI